MFLRVERDALIQKIEAIFAYRLAGKDLARFLKALPLVNQRHGYEPADIEKFYRGHSWMEMIAVNGLVYRFTDIDFLDEMSDEALAYYFPAFLITLLHQPYDLVYTTLWVERVVALLSRFRSDQLDLLLEYAEFMVRAYETQMQESSTRTDEPHMQDFEEIGLRILMYRDEMGSLLKRREERQAKNTNTSS